MIEWDVKQTSECSVKWFVCCWRSNHDYIFSLTLYMTFNPALFAQQLQRTVIICITFDSDAVIWIKLVILTFRASWTRWWCTTDLRHSDLYYRCWRNLEFRRNCEIVFLTHNNNNTNERCDLPSSFKSVNDKRARITIAKFLSIFSSELKKDKSPQIIFVQKDWQKEAVGGLWKGQRCSCRLISSSFHPSVFLGTTTTKFAHIIPAMFFKMGKINFLSFLNSFSATKFFLCALPS